MRYILLIILVLSVPAFAATKPRVNLHVTGGVTGDIVIELDPNKAPITCANFINYVKSGFYNGTIFHRVMPGFMIQGGGYDGNLNKKARDPNIINESYNRLSNLRGTVAMARTSYPDSANSEFFINVANNTFLDYGTQVYDLDYKPTAIIGYCVFGTVVSGMTVVDTISNVARTGEVPNVDIFMTATVTVNGPVCATKLDGDINKDCKVDFKDFALMSQKWLNCNSILPTCN